MVLQISDFKNMLMKGYYLTELVFSFLALFVNHDSVFKLDGARVNSEIYIQIDYTEDNGFLLVNHFDEPFSINPYGFASH